jgi:hypothetical protein
VRAPFRVIEALDLAEMALRVDDLEYPRAAAVGRDEPRRRLHTSS